MAELCKRCCFFPVYTHQGYGWMGLCLRALMRDEDCRRCVPSQQRAALEAQDAQAD